MDIYLADSVRAFLRRNKLGKYNPEEQAAMKEQQTKEAQEEEDKAKAIQVGERWEYIPLMLSNAVLGQVFCHCSAVSVCKFTYGLFGLAVWVIE